MNYNQNKVSFFKTVQKDKKTEGSHFVCRSVFVLTAVFRGKIITQVIVTYLSLTALSLLEHFKLFFSTFVNDVIFSVLHCMLSLFILHHVVSG